MKEKKNLFRELFEDVKYFYMLKQDVRKQKDYGPDKWTLAEAELWLLRYGKISSHTPEVVQEALKKTIESGTLSDFWRAHEDLQNVILEQLLWLLPEVLGEKRKSILLFLKPQKFSAMQENILLSILARVLYLLTGEAKDYAHAYIWSKIHCQKTMFLSLEAYFDLSRSKDKEFVLLAKAYFDNQDVVVNSAEDIRILWLKRPELTVDILHFCETYEWETTEIPFRAIYKSSRIPLESLVKNPDDQAFIRENYPDLVEFGLKIVEKYPDSCWKWGLDFDPVTDIRLFATMLGKAPQYDYSYILPTLQATLDFDKKQQKLDFRNGALFELAQKFLSAMEILHKQCNGSLITGKLLSGAECYKRSMRLFYKFIDKQVADYSRFLAANEYVYGFLRLIVDDMNENADHLKLFVEAEAFSLVDVLMMMDQKSGYVSDFLAKICKVMPANSLGCYFRLSEAESPYNHFWVGYFLYNFWCAKNAEMDVETFRCFEDCRKRFNVVKRDDEALVGRYVELEKQLRLLMAQEKRQLEQQIKAEKLDLYFS